MAKSEKKREKETNGAKESVENYGSAIIESKGKKFYSLCIIGQIEGHYEADEKQKTTKYEHLIPLLVAIEESDEISGVLIMLNTIGGDVEAGLAIAELIASMKKPTVSLVLGGGHSIGVPLAVSAKRSFIVPSATMTIHPVRTSGTFIGAPQTYDYLKKMQERIVNFTVRNSHVEKEFLQMAMMKTDEIANDVGSIIDGKTAVKCGLIDRIGGLSDALEELRKLSEKTAE